MLWRMWRKRNVHRAAARCYTPDGGEIFNRIYIVNIYNTYCAHTDTQNRNGERETGGESHLCPERCSALSGGCAGTHKQAGNVCVCVKGGYSVP